ncbi:unnamed protein product, partial [Aureobasidium vineae]
EKSSMPKGKRSARASWLFRNKPAVASANNTFGRFNVSINHDESKAEGSIAIQHAVHLEGFPSEQTLDLVLRPESIVACELFLDNQNHRLPPEVINLIPTNRNDIWSLSLGGGGGKQETTWNYIHPPLEEEQQAEVGVSRKRNRVDSNSQQQSGEPSTKIQKFLWDMPPGSPTEVNTPSSRHITPTSPLTTVNTSDNKSLYHSVSPTTERPLEDEPSPSIAGQRTDFRHNEEKRSGSRTYTPLPAYPAGLEATCTPSPALEKTSSPAWGSSVEMKPTFLPPSISKQWLRTFP